MPRVLRNAKNKSKNCIKKERIDRPAKARRKAVNGANVQLRRSQRRTTNAFASDRITANRLSLPLDFLDRGFTSQVIRKKKENTTAITQRNQHLLNEDLHALLQPVEVSYREESEVGALPNKKVAYSSHNQFLNASSYYLSVITNQATVDPERTCIDVTNTSEDLKNSEDNIGGNEAQSAEVTVTSVVETTINEPSHPMNHTFHNNLHDQVIPKSASRNNYINLNNTVAELSFLDLTTNERLYGVNYRFCHDVFEQIAIKLRSSKRDCILKLKRDVLKINDILEGKASATSTPDLTMSVKRMADEEHDKSLGSNLPLVPKSQWVYSTPDKQNIKEFVFEESSNKIVPAVIRTSKKCKVLYDIKNEVAQHLNMNALKSQNVLIDRRYLKTICENPIDNDAILPKPPKKQRMEDDSDKENVFAFAVPKPKPSDFVFEPFKGSAVSANNSKDDFNLFLSGDSEESIDIHQEIQRGNECVMDLSFEEMPVNETVKNVLCDTEEKCHNFDFRKCRSALPKELHNFESDPYDAAPIDYRHQLLMATQRPAKTTRKIQKRHLLKAKSLSFENTPPGAKSASFEPKRIEMTRSMEDECIDHFEKEFCSLNDSSFNNLMDIPHTVTSGALEYDEDNHIDLESLNENVKTMFKYYPRRNFDPE